MSRIILFTLLFFSLVEVKAQQYNFITYTVDDGLPQSQVTCIEQDFANYLWVGTQTGLSRFDGITFQNFSVSDGLTDNKIDEILIEEKNIWVASTRGLSKFVDGKFIPYFFQEIINVNDLLWVENRIVIATDKGLIYFENDKFRLAQKDSSDLKIRAVVNCNKKLFCGTPNGLFLFDNSNYWPVEQLDSLNWNISDLHVQNDTLFIATYGHGVYKYEPITGYLELITDRLVNIRDLFVKNQTIQAGTKNGLIIHTPENDLYLNQQNGLTVEQVKCSFMDNEGNTWIGTDGGGLFKYVGDALISFGLSDGLSSNAVMAISKINDRYLFGTYNAGLTVYGNNTIIYNEDDGLSDDRIWGIETWNETVYLATDNGISILKEERFSTINDPQIRHKLRTILKKDSSLFFGGVMGVFELKNGIIQAVPNTQNLNVNKLEKIEDEIFIGANTGLFKLNQSGELEQIELPENDVNTILADNVGNLWIGTTNGLFILHQNVLFPLELNVQEFKSRHILGLVQDKKSIIWAATTFGVYSIDFDETDSKKIKINQYGRVEGLVNLECNLNAIFEDDRGFIWVGTSTGLCRIDPSKTKKLFDLQPPKIQFTNLRLFLEKFDFTAYKVKLDEVTHLPKAIVLPYNKNHLTFDFMGINLSDPKSVKYEYRLLGLDENWSPLQKDNYATYSFISPGEYKFEVRAANKNYEWSPVISMDVEILSPFWRTWWFITLLMLTGLGLVVLVFRIRIRSINQRQANEKLEYKNRLQLLEQRSLNASMNRHFIFNSLNSIQYYINSSDKRSANKYLTSFAKLIRKNLDSSVQNNFIIPLQEEIERIELYLNLEKMRFKEKFEFYIDVDPELELEDIEIPSMILQPFVENSLIHGILPLKRPGNITISIFEEFEDLVFEVVDDGIGIDQSMALKKDQSSGDHESQGVEITNRRIELLRRITGDMLLIVGPYQRNNEEGECLGTKVVIKMPMNISQKF